MQRAVFSALHTRFHSNGPDDTSRKARPCIETAMGDLAKYRKKRNKLAIEIAEKVVFATSQDILDGFAPIS